MKDKTKVFIVALVYLFLGSLCIKLSKMLILEYRIASILVLLFAIAFIITGMIFFEMRYLEY